MDHTFVGNWFLKEEIEDRVVLDKQSEVKSGQSLVLKHLGMLHLDLQVAVDHVHDILQLPTRPLNW